MKLTLVFKNLRIFLMKLEELHVKEIKKDERTLMEAGWWGEKNENEENVRWFQRKQEKNQDI